MLIINNLHVSYKKEKEVLKGLSLSMETGKVHGLAGFNGAGKTTLLNTIYQFITQQAGEIFYKEEPLKRKDIAYLEAENYFYPYMTGREYLSLFPTANKTFDMEGWQQLFSLPLDEIIDNYSTGMRKKLALLAVLKPDKPVMILDEPFNGLDLESTHLLAMIIAQLQSKGKTILITSHIYESLTGCCDYIHYLSDGVIPHSYPKEEFPLLQKELQSVIEQQSGQLIKGLL
ncbi:ABC-2 type transport system ATP-binding protein [Parabacteroides sp. PF5-5]|uniref:ATP-binding cassette domain-containing protein n=1 Tax=unclassified Parabacteroides TaxID=2649774 RepID=UPI0024737BE8|nr:MULTISPECIES: ATP-binding cassette domain-containing protein [unclassified Parabacteroides]MDH6303536.1 ABC-2 type transport system ATP-binding protein [Parabacteroides sp. PH5-39]MDH6314858.1 ABC-2 type transport system ATP-binding protein [Parabacteroides sp. PF5-13]MDH6318195.1 ABC-2 type transport system ATP-binding protein [Parabacteroides sp. PH5-13]MDH6321872.1 ABC-2 type transport system ATP-binding protein [Parabacteroides sp. PH5-8]MDH6325996.1 ABC-2 type transport system ATP-bind